MKKSKLYKYTREDGGVTVSPEKPACEYTEMLRLLPDDGKALVKDGEKTLYSCIDTESTDGWSEVDKSIEEEPSDEEI